jgi:glycolate oxidase
LSTDLASLVAELGADVVLTEPDRTYGYQRDRAFDPQAGLPLAVVRARSTEDVQAAVRFCARHRVPVVPRGAGTGLSGGASAVEGCVVISTERMTAIDIDPYNRVATVQPGLLNAQVKEAAAEHGLWYPPDPSSYQICSIGGNVATNAGGLCCVKYGVTTDYVLGVSVVLADGTFVKLGGPRLKDVAGLPLAKLFVGSEGTLGVITEVVLRLIQEQRVSATLVASFESLADATAAVLDITTNHRPCMLELMDNATINAVEDMVSMGLNRDAAAMVVIQSDEPAGHASTECARMAGRCEQHHAAEVFATDDFEEGEAFVAARRLAVPAIERLGAVLMEDVGVPLRQLGALIDGVAKISAASELTIAVVAHAGDGNTHPMIVFDPADEEMAQRATASFGEVMELAMRLGGTITGEHGVGRLKQPWLGDYLGPEALALNLRVKRALDPDGILNPGSLFAAQPRD